MFDSTFQTFRTSRRLLMLACLILIGPLVPFSANLTRSFAAELELQVGDHICLVGNGLGERLQHHHYWESLLHQRFADKKLVVRNLCIPGDEPDLRIRSQNFGTPSDHLTACQATVVLYFFGANESFRGEEGLSDFTQKMTRLVEETKAQDFSGKGAPRIVLVSPIAFEDTHDPHLPTGEIENKHLAIYTEALASVALANDVGFVDLFQPTKDLFEQTERNLTLNGFHLSDAGYEALAPLFDQALFGEAGDNTGHQVQPKVLAEVKDKNFHWWNRYRAVNGYSIYGQRGLAGYDGTYNNRDVMERERDILSQMTSNRDERIWKVVSGQAVSDQVNDSNTLEFIQPKSNVRGNSEPDEFGSTMTYKNAAEQQELFTLADGYEVQLVASEEQFPELANPVALQFDNQGRLWVSTMPSYPHWQPKSAMNDKLLILEDHDQDGTADECKVFAGGLHQPTGFALGHHGVYVSMQPDILFLQDTDGDDQADTRRRELIGFDSADSHHGIAAFEWGPGGNLYFQEGTFKRSAIESPYGVTRLANAGVWRYHPKSRRFDAHINFAFSNPWGHSFDRWGQEFIGDASPGFSYWASPISGKIDYPEKHPGGSQQGRIAKSMGEDPNIAFPPFYEQRTRPSAGVAIVSSRHFPDEVQGNFLVTNCISDLSVLSHQVRDAGSGFVGTETEPIISSRDGNFRPVDLQFAPDGSLYIVDWHNALIGHLQHNLRDPNRDHSHGRIWRVTYPSRPLVEPAKIAGQPVTDLLELLTLPEDRTRYRVRRELAQRASTDVLPATDRWVDNLDPSDDTYSHHLLEALWVYQTQDVVNEELLRKVLQSKDYQARAGAVRVLSFWNDRLPNFLSVVSDAIKDQHPRVRLEAVRALSFTKGDAAIEVALQVLEHEMDSNLQYTLDETMRVLE